MLIKFPIQAEGKHCGWCHFLHSREGCLQPIPDQPRYFCDAFAQEVEADKKDRPLRVDDCLKGEVKDE